MKVKTNIKAGRAQTNREELTDELMTEQDAVWSVRAERDYFTSRGSDSAFACGACRRDITLFGCTFTPNRWREDGTLQRGALVCPHCGKSTARAFMRLILDLQHCSCDNTQ
jgi:hypothetical protein